jgi:8-oxo-dGTP diphosphatase
LYHRKQNELGEEACVLARAIDFHMNENSRHLSPFAVLVFPVFDDGILWVRHHTRGWEPPGGKVDAGESPEQAARREVWEESGATLDALQWVAEYGVVHGEGLVQNKWVYVAQVRDIGARPQNVETVDVGLMKPVLTPPEVRQRSDISFILKDDMYEALFPCLQHHLDISKGAVR